MTADGIGRQKSTRYVKTAPSYDYDDWGSTSGEEGSADERKPSQPSLPALPSLAGLVLNDTIEASETTNGVTREPSKLVLSFDKKRGGSANRSDTSDTDSDWSNNEDEADDEDATTASATSLGKDTALSAFEGKACEAVTHGDPMEEPLPTHSPSLADPNTDGYSTAETVPEEAADSSELEYYIPSLPLSPMAVATAMAVTQSPARAVHSLGDTDQSPHPADRAPVQTDHTLRSMAHSSNPANLGRPIPTISVSPPKVPSINVTQHILALPTEVATEPSYAPAARVYRISSISVPKTAPVVAPLAVPEAASVAVPVIRVAHPSDAESFHENEEDEGYTQSDSGGEKSAVTSTGIPRSPLILSFGDRDAFSDSDTDSSAEERDWLLQKRVLEADKPAVAFRAVTGAGEDASVTTDRTPNTTNSTFTASADLVDDEGYASSGSFSDQYSFESNNGYEAELVTRASRASTVTTDSQRAHAELLLQSDDEIATDVQRELDRTESLGEPLGEPLPVQLEEPLGELLPEWPETSSTKPTSTMSRIDDLLDDIERYTKDDGGQARGMPPLSTSGLLYGNEASPDEASPVKPLNWQMTLDPASPRGGYLDYFEATPPLVASPKAPVVANAVSRTSTVRRPPPLQTLATVPPLSMVSPALLEAYSLHTSYSSLADVYMDGASSPANSASRNSSTGSLSTGRLTLRSTQPRDSVAPTIPAASNEVSAFDTFRPLMQRTTTNLTAATVSTASWNPDAAMLRETFMTKGETEGLSRSNSTKSVDSSATLDADPSRSLTQSPSSVKGPVAQSVSSPQAQRYTSMLSPVEPTAPSLDHELPPLPPVEPSDHSVVGHRVATNPDSPATRKGSSASETGTATLLDRMVTAETLLTRTVSGALPLGPELRQVSASSTTSHLHTAFKPSLSGYSLAKILAITNNQELKLLQLKDALAVERATDTGLDAWLVDAMKAETHTSELAMGKFASEAFKNASISEVHRSHTFGSAAIKSKLVAGTSDVKGIIGGKGSSFAKGLFSKTKKIMRSA